MFNASLKITDVKKYFFKDNPVYVTMLFRNTLSNQEGMWGIMRCLCSQDILLHYRRVWGWQELSAVCDDPVPSESV